MPSRVSCSASRLPENQGNRRENGTDRTSTSAVTPAPASSAAKRSAGRLEWPIVNRSKSAGAIIGSLSVVTAPSLRLTSDGLTSGATFPLHRGQIYAILLAL
jgi:hypothetical protein